jgi:peptidoglycan hydrolase-like protein with peptidoglycan-binding domain
MDISSAFRLMQHWPELKRAYDIWNRIKAPFTEMIDIIRKVGGDVGFLEPDKHPEVNRQVIMKIKESPLGKYGMDWVQETLAMSGMPGGTPGLKVDGDAGPATHAAIKKFQAAHPPLKADGWAGLQTMAVLEMERKRLS